MESNTRALEVVCAHFKEEYSNKELLGLRRKLNTAHVQNHRLRKNAQKLTDELAIERNCRQILHRLIQVLLTQRDSGTSRPDWGHIGHE